MFKKLPRLIVSLLLAFFCVTDVNAGNFNTSEATEGILHKAKVELKSAQKGGGSFDEAESLLQQAAKQGSEEAYLILGRLYTRHPEKKDFATASLWLKKAAELGSTKAMDMMSVIYLDGRVIEPDHNKAMSWMQRGSDAGDLDATYSLGFFYLEGEGVPRDPVRGKSLMKEAALKGHSYSIDYFVEEAEKGNSEAKQFLEKLHAEQGHDSEAFKKYRQEAK